MEVLCPRGYHPEVTFYCAIHSAEPLARVSRIKEVSILCSSMDSQFTVPFHCETKQYFFEEFFLFTPLTQSYVYHNTVTSFQGKCLYFTYSQQIYSSTQHIINFSEKQKCPEFYKMEEWKGPSWEAWCVLTLSQLKLMAQQQRATGRTCWKQTLALPAWPNRTSSQEDILSKKKKSTNDSSLFSCH